MPHVERRLAFSSAIYFVDEGPLKDLERPCGFWPWIEDKKGWKNSKNDGL